MTNSINTDLFNRFLKDFWPKHRTQLYKDLYNTYHPSAYVESFNRPGGNFEDALETVADAVHEGKKLGLLDSSVDWSDTINYDALDLESDADFPHPGIDDNGIPTLNNQLEIIDNANLDWIHGILLFDVYEDIVEEFKHYCGENGIDESGMGKCMGEFPPDARGEMINGTLKQDYYTLYNFMKELERAGVNVKGYMKSPIFPNVIKLVDDGSTDYDTTGEYSPMRQDDEAIDTEKVYKSFGIEPDRIEEQEEPTTPEEEPIQSIFQKTLKDMGVQFQFVGTFGFGISGMFGMVKDVLEGRYPSLSEGEIILIFLSGLSYLSINLVKDLKEVKQEIEKRGLKEYVNKAVELLKDFENISLKVVEKAGYTISSLAELLGYTFLLVPILDVTNRLIAENGFDVVSLASYLKGVIISVGIFYIRNLFNSLVLRLRDNREKKQIYGDKYEVDDNAEDEMIEEGKFIGKVLTNRFIKSTILTESRIGELSLLDDSINKKSLKWIVTEENKINWLNLSISKSIEKFNNNKKLFTSTNIKEITTKFKNKDLHNLNNYESLIELNQITNKLTKKSKLHEEVYMGKIAEKATTNVVRDVFEVVTLFEGGEDYFLLPDYYTDQDGDEYRYGELQFNVEVNIIENKQEENFVIDSLMGGENDDTIYLDIVLSDNFNEKDYESLQIVLSEYIRHEIEHILQIIDSERPDIIDKDDTMSPFDYYSQEHEIDAQKVGFERRAKMEDKSMEEVIKDYLGYRQSIDNLSDTEKQELIGKLTN
jgi:hypothetical protein